MWRSGGRYRLAAWADWLAGWRDRAVCRLARWHGPGCRGRADHSTADGRIIDPGRWRH